MVQKRAPSLCKILTLIVVWLVLYLLMFWSNTRRHDPINRYLVRQNCDTKLKFGEIARLFTLTWEGSVTSVALSSIVRTFDTRRKEE